MQDHEEFLSVYLPGFAQQRGSQPPANGQAGYAMPSAARPVLIHLNLRVASQEAAAITLCLGF